MSVQAFEDPQIPEDPNDIAEALLIDREDEPPPGTEGIEMDRDTGPEDDAYLTEELMNEAGGGRDDGGA